MVNQEGEEWRKAGRARWVENERSRGHRRTLERKSVGAAEFGVNQMSNSCGHCK